MRQQAPGTALLFGVAAVALFHAALLWGGSVTLTNLADMDAYARLLRLRQLWETQAWYDPVLRALGAPFGTEFHWGRAIDLLALPAVSLGAAVAGIDRSLFVVALLFAPVLHALAAGVLVWGGRRVLPPQALWLLPVLFLAQRNVSHYFEIGYFDHHAVLGAAAVAVTVLALEHLSTGRSRPLAAAALVCAFTTWATPEGLLIAGQLVLTLGALWVWRDGPYLRSLQLFSVWLAGALAVGLVAERPPGDLLTVEVDRLSIIHLTAAAVLALLVFLACRWRGVQEGAGAARRWAVAGGSAMVGAALLLALFPELLAGGYLAGSYGAVSPEVRVYLLDNVPDDKPFLPVNPVMTYNFLLDLGYAFPALAWALLALRREATPRHVLYVAQLVFYLPLALAVARMTIYVEVALLLPLAECLVVLVKRLRDHRRWIGRVATLAALLAAALGPVLAAAGVRAVWLPGAPPAAHGCDYSDLARFMKSRGLTADKTRTILAPLFNAPEIAYRTGLPTVGGPFHRDENGVRDTMVLFYAAPEDPLARQVARQRRLGYVVLCRAELPATARMPDTMLRSLVLRQPPAWMTAVALPPGLADRFILYASHPLMGGR